MTGKDYYLFMRFLGIVAKTLLIVFPLTAMNSPAFSAPKMNPGSTCKVLNQEIIQQNMVYTCMKSGKKLVWSKGAAIKVSAGLICPKVGVAQVIQTRRFVCI